MPTGYVYDNLFLNHYTAGHVESPDRLKSIMSRLESDNLLRMIQHIPYIEATEADLQLVHSKVMIDKVREASKHAPTWLDPDTYVSPNSYQIAAAAAGGGIKLVSEIVAGSVTNGMALIRPPGHHATPTRSMGFCLFNNVAIAARYLQTHHRIEKVAIIDWDVHHGNGTQDVFYDDPTVLYMSTHLYPHYPGTGSEAEQGEENAMGTTRNFPLRFATSVKDYLENFNHGLKEIKTFDPDFILISAGFDSHADDPLGGLSLRENDFALMTKQICKLANETCDGKVASFLEGGYNLDSLASSVAMHIKVLIEEG